MGIYIYAINTDIRTVSSESIGVAEFRYKESFAFCDNSNEKNYNTKCKRRISHFENYPFKIPTLMTYCDSINPNQMVVGREVYLCKSVCFSDTKEQIKVGVLCKVGNRWNIKYLIGGIELVNDHKAKVQADLAKTADW